MLYFVERNPDVTFVVDISFCLIRLPHERAHLVGRLNLSLHHSLFAPRVLDLTVEEGGTDYK